MNEAEQRRKRLLEETKNLYSDKKIPPAIHPRYHSFYEKLYGKDNEHSTEVQGTFAIRGFICVLLFCLFVAADYKEASVAKVDSKRVIKEIEHQIDVELK